MEPVARHVDVERGTFGVLLRARRFGCRNVGIQLTNVTGLEPPASEVVSQRFRKGETTRGENAAQLCD